MTGTSTGTPHRRRVCVLLVGGTFLVAACLLFAGCGGGSGAAATARTGTPSRPGPAPGGTRGGIGRGGARAGRPAAYGQIAALSGDTMQVQNSVDGQVAVTFGSTTTFTQTVPVTTSALTPGRCVSAMGNASAAGASAPGSDTTPFTAATLTVSDPIDGSCQRVAPGGAGGAPPSVRPSKRSRPSGFPSRTATAGNGARIQFAAGTITSASAGSLTIDQPARGTRPAADVTVHLGSATRIITTRPATSAALAVGRCITATGTAGPTGTVAATRIGISDPDANGCQTGFGGLERGGGRDGS